MLHNFILWYIYKYYLKKRLNHSQWNPHPPLNSAYIAFKKGYTASWLQHQLKPLLVRKYEQAENSHSRHIRIQKHKREANEKKETLQENNKDKNKDETVSI